MVIINRTLRGTKFANQKFCAVKLDRQGDQQDAEITNLLANKTTIAEL